jgi:glycosyltransferase involved in cell wall biosynthesis
VIDGIRSLGMDEEAVRLHFVGMQRMLLACDFATCTTEELAAEMRRAGRPVSVVPNGFDAAGRRAARQARRQWLAGRPDRLLRIGYAAGTRTHQRDMQVAAPAIARVLAEVPDARLVLFRNPQDGSRLVDPGDLPALAAVAGQIEWRDQVPLAALPAELARFDINIAPLELGNPFVEAKSELKYFEAALAGVPTIASPTGPFRRALCDGTTGLLAADEAAWHAALRRLLGDAALRASLAQAALADALRRFGPASQSRAIGAALALAARDRSESM